jgi:hypothetical protein
MKAESVEDLEVDAVAEPAEVEYLEDDMDFIDGMLTGKGSFLVFSRFI